jgi:hypothetical protein
MNRAAIRQPRAMAPRRPLDLGAVERSQHHRGGDLADMLPFDYHRVRGDVHANTRLRWRIASREESPMIVRKTSQSMVTPSACRPLGHPGS